ncbi:hypothetical protein D3C71_1140490 [compost metagenome]
MTVAVNTPSRTDLSACTSVGRCVLALAWVNAPHSTLFQNHSGICSCSTPALGSTANTRTLLMSRKVLAYSPLGSSTMKRALGSAPSRALRASSIDQRIKPATEQDLPLPVLPSTARWRPNKRSGSILTWALAASGLLPIKTWRLSPDSTMARSWFCVGSSTASPTVG